MAATVEVEKKFSVVVSYNGVPETIEVNEHQALQAVFQHALKAFDLQGSGGNFILTLGGDGELDLNTKVGDAGLQPGSQLHLRPRQTRGG